MKYSELWMDVNHIHFMSPFVAYVQGQARGIPPAALVLGLARFSWKQIGKNHGKLEIY